MNDSIWALVASMSRTYHITPEYILYELSYSNLILYNAVIPTYKSKTDGDGKQSQEVIKMDDPANKEKIKDIFDSFT